MPHKLDIEIGPRDIQVLSDAGALAAFFARLGYHTDARTPQTPGNLGIAAEGTARPIRKIELIADQEGLFQVYLFELTSVTISHTRALTRTFRNRAGNYLLILTSDYERLDFVLLEKHLPVSGNGSGLAQKQVAIRPRILTVERRKPDRVHLRVLRRFTWTESDPFAQYDKILSAYTVADWSEEFFNNRALFSDYYLKERLPEFPAWAEDPKPAYRLLRERYQGVAGRVGGKDRHVLGKDLLEPVLEALGFEVKPGKASADRAEEPDYRLYARQEAAGRGKDSPLRAICLAYAWGRSLDGKDDRRDTETPEENPGARVVSLLEKGEAPWAVVTNGKLYRLYAQRAHSRATNYYEIDLEEVLAQAGPHAADLSESFRYFWMLFRRQAFDPEEVEREGKKVSLCLLDRLLLESEDYAKELGERLKERVFEDVFPHLAAGFIAHLREAQKWHRDAVANARAKREAVSKYESGPVVEQRWGALVDELFNVKVLDPAMGSGHFLVEAVDVITDKALDFLNAFPWNPVRAHLTRMRETILEEMDEQGITIDPGRLTDVNLLKRHVLKRCIYGVDLNPMAVELAKVSLWLDCFTLGAPLSFLDHHLRCGNSLIGVTVDEVNKAIETGQLNLLAGSKFEGMKQAVAGMVHVGELSDVTAAQVHQSRAEYNRASDALKPAKRLLDIYASQWFGNTPRIVGRGEKKVEHNPALEFLRDGASEPWAQRPERTKLPREWAEVTSVAVRASQEKRFFHWELEFPEVFYGPRPGTHQKIERLEGEGFDAVIGNPPYDVLASEELGYDVSQDLEFYEAMPVYEPAIRGKKNLYKLFVCRGVAVTGATGAFSFIVPMPLLGDDQAAGVRRMLLEKTGLVAVEAFPQKDDPRNRVFPEAKLATTIFVTQAKPSNTPIAVRTHPGRMIEETSSILRVRPEEIIKFDPENAAIPSCTQRDWDIAVAIVGHEKVKRLGDYCRASQGEVNETTDGKKGFISTKPKDGPQILRGSNICLYVLREASQGEEIYLRKKKYLEGKPDSVKARHHEQRRVGWQESSPQNNFRRIIATTIPKGEFCNHKINYIPEGDSQLCLDFVLTLLNSEISDWYFRLGSTNAAVSHYQIYNLPAPTTSAESTLKCWKQLLDKGQWTELGSLLCEACAEPGVMPKPVADAIAEMSRRIQEIETKRVLKNRSERSHLAPESQPIQNVIDAVLFRCYGLSEEDGRYIEKRLGEML